MDARQKLVTAAVALFAKKGYLGTSTREIAQNARVNPVTLYRSFGNKASLYTASVQWLFNKNNLSKRIADTCAQPLSAEELIASVIDTVVECMAENPLLYRIILYAALERGSPSMRKENFESTRKQMLPKFDVLQRCIEEGIKTGKFRNVDAAAAARLIIGTAVYHHQTLDLYGVKRVSASHRRALSNTYAELLYEGLRK